MSFITGLAMRRPTVTILAILLILAGGVYTFRTLEQELFPEIEFPNITITTTYPSADPDAVVRDVTDEIETSIKGMSGLVEIQSTSSDNLSVVIATFEFGEDMEDVERTIRSNLSGIDFPEGVGTPFVSRIANDVFPVLQLGVLGDRDIPSLQKIVDDLIVSTIEGVPGVAEVNVLGESEEQVQVTMDVQALEDLNLPASRVAAALSDTNVSIPAGTIDDGATVYSVRTSHRVGSLSEIRDSIVGFESNHTGMLTDRPILVSDIAEVGIGTRNEALLSRTNGKPSLTLYVLKEPDANTVAVTKQVLADLEALEGLPPDIEVVTITNDGPEVEAQLDTLLQEGLLGFLFAISVVFIFLVNFRSGLFRGVALTLRPTAIIGISIPLSILSGVLIMGLAGLSLNFMSLSGLAIAVGRVVDDSIVVLENIYRHIQAGDDRIQAGITGTREVSAAIVASTLTTVVVFIPLAFIQGLVGSFFSPFAYSVSFALLASTVVALTAVPVLAVTLLRRGDLPDGVDAGSAQAEETFQLRLLQRIYQPVLAWSLRHKLPAVLAAIAITGSSLGLVFVIPITLFPSAAPQFVIIEVELPTGASMAGTFREVQRLESVLFDLQDQGFVETYQISIGSLYGDFGPGSAPGGTHLAGAILRMTDDVPGDIADTIKESLPDTEETTISVKALSNGPPSDNLEVIVTGGNYSAISSVTNRLEAAFSAVEGVANIRSDVSEAREELVIRVDRQLAAEYGLTALVVALQVNRYLVGETVAWADLDNSTIPVVLKGEPEDFDDIEELQSLSIESPLGPVQLGAISRIAVEQGPLSISRFDGERSASITGDIVAVDTQAVGREIQFRIDSVDTPPGVQVKSGGIFQQVAEGFEDIFTSMAIGIILVYLVMVATLGSLRNPLVIVLSLPLAVVGALIALAVTDRTLSLSALMGLLLLIGVVVTNAIVLLTFVEQLREEGMSVYDALIESARVRMRPILMTAFTTIFALAPLAFAGSSDSGIIGAELATVVIGGLISSTFLTLIVVPVIYTLAHVTIPNGFGRMMGAIARLSPLGYRSAPNPPESETL